MFNIEGFAESANVTGGGDIPETSPYYCKVDSAEKFATAINNIKTSTKAPFCKVIEIAADLNLGSKEVTLGGNIEAQKVQAQKHPVLMASGVSKVNIQAVTEGLTIFSKNGATIKHTNLNIKNAKNVIIRNIKFDEMWEWDEKDKGDYDTNDWDFITLGDGSGEVNGIWIDHCTFTKSYDGIVDIKKASGKGSKNVTISWSEVVPASPAFMTAQFDYLESHRTDSDTALRSPLYEYLRGYFSQEQIMAIATPQKKAFLIEGNDQTKADPSAKATDYTVTLHHSYLKDVQDRMPRLRAGDAHIYNLYANNSNTRALKQMRDDIVDQSPQLAKDLDGVGVKEAKYHFGITSNGSISTEGGAIEVAKSVFLGVLTPLRNNQSAPENSAYTGAIRAVDIIHTLLESDTSYMPLSSQQTTYTDSLGTWATWRGNSGSSGSSLGPTQAPEIAFVWHNGTPSYTAHMHDPTELKNLLSGANSQAGAGRLNLTTSQWLKSKN